LSDRPLPLRTEKEESSPKEEPPKQDAGDAERAAAVSAASGEPPA
jgi:hypothetical protein